MRPPALEVATLESGAATRTFLDGSERAEMRVGPVTIGRGVYHPGWRWSVHVGPQTGLDSQAHVGYVESGRFAVRGSDGTQHEVGPGAAFYAGPGHDAWVVGDEPCVALDFSSLQH